MATDLLHPTGRCTCAGERRCEWCKRICRECDGDGRDFPGTGPCRRCMGSGWEPLGPGEVLTWGSGQKRVLR